MSTTSTNTRTKSSKSNKNPSSSLPGVPAKPDAHGDGSSASSKGNNNQTHKLPLRGSAKLIAEFFDYSINTILFQRGVYPAEDFTPVKKYGLNMLVSSDDQVKAYLKRITGQLTKWLIAGKVKTLVVVITSKESGEDVERWQFDVSPQRGTAGEVEVEVEGGEGGRAAVAKSSENGKQASATTPVTTGSTKKPEAEIQAEIRSLFRQITASVTFLPMLDGRCSFNVLVYADGDVEVPMEWGDSEPREINGGEKVALRSWGTSSHKVETAVSYRVVTD